jgi:hypothetical protein
MSLKNECESLTDIGCSAGIVSYTANLLGYGSINALDHDQECLNMINKINNELSIDTIHTKKISFGDTLPETDIIIMCALIHWIYSCTALYGNFDNIFIYLKNYVTKYLIIEWVDPNDGAILSFNHINYNKNVQQETYNKENFEKSLQKNIGTIISVHGITSTRILHVVKKHVNK